MKKRNGFTLIELLVVISIIALLVGLLMPALAAARQAAISSSCMSNQKQLGYAFASYTTDYRDFFPTYGLSANWTDVTIGSSMTKLWPGMLYDDAYYTSIPVFDCPAFDGVFSMNPGAGVNGLRTSWPGGGWSFVEYGYNYIHLGSDANLLYGTSKGRSARNADIKYPANTIVLADSFYRDHSATTKQLHAVYLIHHNNPASLTVDPRHLGQTVQTLWVDGHVNGTAVTIYDQPYTSGYPSFWDSEVDNPWRRD